LIDATIKHGRQLFLGQHLALLQVWIMCSIGTPTKKTCVPTAS
jgi:hypothetical protein